MTVDSDLDSGQYVTVDSDGGDSTQWTVVSVIPMDSDSGQCSDSDSTV